MDKQTNLKFKKILFYWGKNQSVMRIGPFAGIKNSLLTVVFFRRRTYSLIYGPGYERQEFVRIYSGRGKRLVAAI